MERSRGRVWTAWYTSTWKTCRWCRHHVLCLVDEHADVVATLCIPRDLGAATKRRRWALLRGAWGGRSAS